MAAPQQARAAGVLPSCLDIPFVPMAAQPSLLMIKRGSTVLQQLCASLLEDEYCDDAGGDASQVCCSCLPVGKPASNWVGVTDGPGESGCRPSSSLQFATGRAA